jgi:hypothetical protein
LNNGEEADTSKIEEMSSTGLDKEKAQSSEHQGVERKVGYKDGLWSLVVKRLL